MACAPLLEPTDLKNAAALFSKHDKKHAILAVTDYAVPIEWAYDYIETGKLIPKNTGMFAKPSNELNKTYHDAGAFIAFSADSILSSEGAGSDENYVGYTLPRSKAIDIDSQEDWEIAEAIYQYRNNSKSS